MNLSFRKKRMILQVEDVELPLNMAILDINSKAQLESLQHGEVLIETPKEFYLINSKGDTAFHFCKPGLPEILKVEKLELNPDSFSAKVELTQQSLFDLAKKRSMYVFEDVNGWYVTADNFVFFTTKVKPK